MEKLVGGPFQGQVGLNELSKISGKVGSSTFTGAQNADLPFSLFIETERH